MARRGPAGIAAAPEPSSARGSRRSCPSSRRGGGLRGAVEQGERRGSHRVVKVPAGTVARGNRSSGGRGVAGREGPERSPCALLQACPGRAAAPGAAAQAAASAALGTLRGGGTEEGRPGGRRGRPVRARAEAGEGALRGQRLRAGGGGSPPAPTTALCPSCLLVLFSSALPDPNPLCSSYVSLPPFLSLDSRSLSACPCPSGAYKVRSPGLWLRVPAAREQQEPGICRFRAGWLNAAGAPGCV